MSSVFWYLLTYLSNRLCFVGWTEYSRSCYDVSMPCTLAQTVRSIPLEKLLRAQLLQMLYSIRSVCRPSSTRAKRCVSDTREVAYLNRG